MGSVVGLEVHGALRPLVGMRREFETIAHSLLSRTHSARGLLPGITGRRYEAAELPLEKYGKGDGRAILEIRPDALCADTDGIHALVAMAPTIAPAAPPFKTSRRT